MDKALKVLKSWVGYLEKKSNKDLEDMTKNAGSGNYTIFAKLYKDYTGNNFQGQAWCAMFISVCFVAAYGLETAKKLLCGSLYAYCPYGMAAFKKKGRLHSKPKDGDIVFFLKNGTAYHTGFVYKVSGSTVYTIEGNTSGASGIIPNGGGVCKKAYTVNANMKFGRPDYSTVQDAATKPHEAETKPKKDTGKLTNEAFVKAVQKAVGVAVDGVAGSKTLAACPMLKNGSKGAVVKLVQSALVDLYGCKLPKYGADGDMGSETVAAVKSFQKSKGLTADGIVGAKTWKKLLA